jgi:gamma-glutamylcyclotransferase (GGCT)/AIG2-like uncharacterized protein YtfP
MFNPPLYAFYGSLRQGMPLYDEFRFSLHYQYSCWLPGYALYSLGEYPYAVRNTDSSERILIEVMKVLDGTTEKRIDDIELQAGYFKEQIRIGEDRIWIYLFDHPTNNLKVKSGDWVTFFRYLKETP